MVSRDLLIIAGLSVGACVAVGMAGGGLWYLLRRGSLRHQLLLATLLPVVAVSFAVAVNVRAMFLSSHDSGVVVIALSVALLLAAAGAWLITRPVLRGFSRIAEQVQHLVSESTTPVDLGGEDRGRDTAASAAPPSTESAAPPSADPPDQANSPDPPSPSASLSSERDLPAELARAVTDLDAARRTLREARERERAAERARRELVAFMSHDLRTPLAGMRALSEALEDGIVTDVPRALAHLRATVRRMSLLVDDLFALSRVQGPVDRQDRQQVSLAEVVHDVVTEAASTAAPAGVQLAVEVTPGDPLTVQGSSADLTRALANLVANGVRHTRPGAAVRICASRAASGAVQIEVVDQCGGIPDAHLTRVFDTGWRGSPSRGDDHGRAGLGLAIARGVVQSHSGQIGVHNTGDGCSFQVELPAGVKTG